MIILHNKHSKQSREFIEANADGNTVVDWYNDEERIAYQKLGHPDPSAFPTVIVDEPAYMTDPATIPADDPNNSTGAEIDVPSFKVAATTKALRAPNSWDDVLTYKSAIEKRTKP
jgi:hypothetical protein